jgi:regulator of sigma E protease
MELIIGILAGLIILVLLVVVHELGHAIVAARNGVVVEEFGIGFPPKAWGKKLKNGVLFTLNWLPLGGFVKMQGENDAASKKGDYGAASFWAKTKILFAGVLVNWLVAALILTVLAVTGLPKILPNQFTVASDTTIVTEPVRLMSIVKDSPAEKSGFLVYDEIERFDGKAVKTQQQLIDLTSEYRGKSVEIIYARGGVESKKNVKLANNDKANFGASLSQQERIKATWSAPVVGVATTGQFTWVTLQGLGDVIANFAKGLVSQLSPDTSVRQEGSKQLDTVSASVAGPIGILGVIFPSAAKAGPTELLFLTAIISLTLAVMNVLPIPALDGGRWFLMTLYRLRKKELTKEKEEKIVGISFMILIGLIVLVTIADVGKLGQ